MKKFTKIIGSIISVVAFNSLSVVSATEQPNKTMPVANAVSPILFPIVNVTQYAHSDGYIVKNTNGIKEKLFVGTNTYKAQLEVSHNEKKVLIDIQYSIVDPKVTGLPENSHNPFTISIGKEILSGSNDINNRYVENTSQKEIEKINSIGMTKEDLNKKLLQQFKSVNYI